MEKDGLNEQELMYQLGRGDQTAFRTIFLRYYPKVRSFVLGLLQSEDDAEDLTQEIFAKLWIKRASFTEVQNFGVYLFVLSRNAAYNFLKARQAQREQLNVIPLEEEDNHSPHEDLVAKDLTLLIDMVVENMPPQRRLIYKLSREAGMSNGEIAEKLQLAKKTVENHLNLALKELRNAVFLCAIVYFMQM